MVNEQIAILGYGNQGRAHAMNLRDSGVPVVVGAREGMGRFRAAEDGFEATTIENALEQTKVAVWLLPDQVLPDSLQLHRKFYEEGKRVAGFAHSFVLKYRLFQFPEAARYFLVGPKGAGKILRDNFVKGSGLPAVFALSHPDDAELRALTLRYAKGIGCDRGPLIETTFDLEAEGDLFGEQAVLCGGLLELIRESFEVLVENGHDPKTAFFDVAYEAMLILRLWIDAGPSAMAERISPTAFYGGITRGPRVINEDVRKELRKIFAEVRDGRFAKQWLGEVAAGAPSLQAAKAALKKDSLEKTYQELKPELDRL